MAALLGESATLDASIVPTTEAAWREFTRRSFNRGAQDFAVVEEEGRLVALLTSTLLGSKPPCRHFRIVVHPGWRRRRLATRLLSLVQGQELPSGGLLRCNSMRSWPAGNAFLEANGFRVKERELFMRWRGERPSASAQHDVAIRPYRVSDADDAAWIRLHEAGYGHEPQFSPLTPGDVANSRGAAGFSLHFAVHGDRAVGFCHAERLSGGDTGLINSIVVSPSSRGRGVGARLLAAGVTALVDDGCPSVELNVVHDNTPARRLYERIGFTVFDEQLTYRRSAST